MGRPKKYSRMDFLVAIEGSGGIIDIIRKRLGCTWNTAYLRIKKDKVLQQAYNDACEVVLDDAENAIQTSIRGGNTADAKWYLAVKGKHRGYGDVISGEGTGVTINIVRSSGSDSQSS